MRIIGVDITRFVAFVGITVNHVFTSGIEARALWDVHAIGFALLVGFGLSQAVAPGGGWRPVKQAWARAAVLVAVGLTLHATAVNAAPVLVQLALVTVVVAPLARLRRRTIAAVAAALCLLAPVAVWCARRFVPAIIGTDLGWIPVFAHPIRSTMFLLVGGYYPVATWLAVATLGLLLGRVVDLTRRAHLGRMATVGALASAAAVGASMAAVGLVGAPERYSLHEVSFGEFPDFARDPRWLAGLGPYLPSPASLVFSVGIVLTILAGICAITRPGADGPARSADSTLGRYLAAAGAMALSMYTIHVWVLGVIFGWWLPALRTAAVAPPNLWWVWAGQLAVIMAFVAFWRRFAPPQLRRGPLEWASRAFARRVIRA